MKRVLQLRCGIAQRGFGSEDLGLRASESRGLHARLLHVRDRIVLVHDVFGALRQVRPDQRVAVTVHAGQSRKGQGGSLVHNVERAR